jgi:hypothetical protein
VLAAEICADAGLLDESRAHLARALSELSSMEPRAHALLGPPLERRIAVLRSRLGSP